MQPHLTRKMARWAAAAALAVALVAGGIFAYRQSLSSRAMRHAPPAVPPSVRQRSLKFTFSKMDGQQTVFTIRAARATRYRGRTGSLLEDVDIVVNGRHGERHDEIHTRSCEYEPQTGAIVCHGKVELNLSGVPLSRPVKLSSSGGIHIATQDVTFNRDTGTAATGAPVTFRFPQGEGSGDGADYSSRGAEFRLRSNVKLTLAAGRSGGAPTTVTAQGGLTFDRRTNQLLLRGPVEIRQGDRQIDAGELTVDLSNRLRPLRAFTGGMTGSMPGGKTLVRAAQGSRSGNWQARSIEILFDGQGRAEQVNAVGQVVFTGNGTVATPATSPAGTPVITPAVTEIRAQKASVALDPADAAPRTIDLRGHVQIEEKRPAGLLRLNSDSLRLVAASAAAGAKTLKLVRATVPGQAEGEWYSENGDLRMTSGRLAIRFGAGNRIEALRGAGGVRLERQEKGQTPLLTTADNMNLDFSAGRWTRAEESGNVRATQGTRSGSADRAVWLRSSDAFELDGNARVGDPRGELLADSIAWNRKSGALQATGHVRSIYKGASGPGGAATGRPQAVNVVAAALKANSQTGHAVFSGSARVWTGNLVVQADRIELRRAAGELTATGNVRAAFPQVPFQGAFSGNGKGGPGASHPGQMPENGGQKSPVLWRVKAERLEYVPQKQPASSPKGVNGEVTLDGGVQAWSSENRIEAMTLVLNLLREPGGQLGLSRATGRGGVTIRQGNRWGQAENARYDAAAGRFVLWGGSPSLHDSGGDLVRGARLTFSQTNDTILVESSEGSRTLTRHPVRN